jgi:hypothetical protein
MLVVMPGWFHAAPFRACWTRPVMPSSLRGPDAASIFSDPLPASVKLFRGTG